MKNALIIGTLCAAALPAQQIRRDVVAAGAGEPFALSFISSEMSWEDKLVKNAPYSADAVTETTQTLPDGNRITNKQSSTVYRDSEGRTRREQSINSVGPWSSEQQFKTVFINDPVARVNYILNPKNKTSRRIELPPAGSGPAGAGQAAVHTFETMNVKVRGGMVGTAVMAPPHEGNVMMKVELDGATGMRRAAGNQTYQNISIGKQTIEGVECEGTRTTLTIAAGEIGNERPIEIVSEKWVSPDLGVTVMSRRTDPRAGETVYRLTNLQRVEPARSLFEAPSDYKQEDERLFLRKLDKGPNEE